MAIFVEEIKSICPAPGWYGVFLLSEEPYYDCLPLSCWANVLYSFDCNDNEVFPGIVGMVPLDGLLEECESIDNFLTYVQDSEIENPDFKKYFLEESQRYREKK